MFRLSRDTLRALAFGAVVALITASTASAALMSVDGVSEDNAINNSIGEAQISIEFEDAGLDAITGDTLVTFTFRVEGDQQMAITQVYFDGGVLNMITSLDDTDSGVNYQIDRGPPMLSGGKPLGFIATNGLRAGAKLPTSHSGIDPGETLSITISLSEGSSFSDAIGALMDGSMRIGMHVQAFPNGDSASFINEPLVPSPGGIAALGLGAVGLMRRRR